MGRMEGRIKRGVLRLGRQPELKKAKRLFFRLGLDQRHDAVAFLPFSTLFQQFDSLESLKNITLFSKAGGRLETGMSAHIAFYTEGNKVLGKPK